MKHSKEYKDYFDGKDRLKYVVLPQDDDSGFNTVKNGLTTASYSRNLKKDKK